MALVFERVLTEGIAALSYLIGDDSTGTAAVIDPRTDVAIYLHLARKHKVAITHAFETHIHADFVSGARELAAQSGSAKVYASSEGGAKYGFPVEPIRNGDRFEFGNFVLTARHTPGHTPEHLSFEASQKECAEPFAVFTGDSLMVDSVGRPDLLGHDADKLAAQSYDTIFGYFGRLGDGVIIHPSHGHGSPCGAEIGDRLESTIGYEKQFNPYFQLQDREKFVQQALCSAPPEPTYYKRMKALNSEGPQALGHLPVIPALAPRTFRASVEERAAILVDTRPMLAFGGGHIEGALNIGGTPMLTIWAGWLLDPDRPILLVLKSDSNVDEIAALFARSGYTRFAGYLAGGMEAWDKLGYPHTSLTQMTVDEVEACSDNLQVLDVRAHDEFEEGHVPCAKHIFVPEVRDRAAELKKSQPIVTYCATGYRASIAASILQRRGFKDVRTIPGSWSAWVNNGLAISKENGD